MKGNASHGSCFSGNPIRVTTFLLSRLKVKEALIYSFVRKTPSAIAQTHLISASLIVSGSYNRPY